MFADGNRDGIRQSVEKGLPSATVSLLDAAGTVIATTTSDPSGRYLFTGLDLGSYRVSVSGTSPGSVPSSPSRLVTITKGADVRSVDVGLSAAASPAKPVAPKPATAPLPTTLFAALGSPPQRRSR